MSMSHPKHNRVARVVIADDNELTRAGVRSLLAGEPWLDIVGEAADGQQAIDLCRQTLPDLALLDVRMPQKDGLAATRAIKAACPATSVIILTMYDSPDYLMAAVAAGAAGYLLKDITRKEMIAAIRDVLGGKVILNGVLAANLIARLPRSSSPEGAERVETLTRRELEVLRLMASGLRNREIGLALTITPGTVKIHVEHILEKLGVSDRTQAAVRAAEWGLLKKDGD